MWLIPFFVVADPVFEELTQERVRIMATLINKRNKALSQGNSQAAVGVGSQCLMSQKKVRLAKKRALQRERVADCRGLPSAAGVASQSLASQQEANLVKKRKLAGNRVANSRGSLPLMVPTAARKNGTSRRVTFADDGGFGAVADEFVVQPKPVASTFPNSHVR